MSIILNLNVSYAHKKVNKMELMPLSLLQKEMHIEVAYANVAPKEWSKFQLYSKRCFKQHKFYPQISKLKIELVNNTELMT